MREKKGEEDESFGYETYLSPFTWRYGSDEMRTIFSERSRRGTWRRVWLELARAESEFGLVSQRELEGISSKAEERFVDIPRAHELEKRIRHDLMAELRTFAEQAGEGGGKLHLGATSMDIEDNSDAIIFRKALDLTLDRMAACLEATREQVLKHKARVCMAWTHLQPAEPTTLGYRLANYAQDLLIDIELITTVRDRFLRGKGMKGAVGTSASFSRLLGSEKVGDLEQRVMSSLGLDYFGLSTQTYPRKVDLILLSALCSIAASCHKFGLDLRVMQSPAIGELSEPLEDLQVGSSAMPFKKNPVTAERMCSLSRLISTFPLVAFGNAANTVLERTLDDSASRRIVIPEAFLAVDECLMIYERLMRGLMVYPAMIERNLERFGPFAGTEALMMKMVEQGGDRQAVHEFIRLESFKAWDVMMKGGPNPLVKMLSENRKVTSRLTPAQVRRLLDPREHTGDANERCEAFVKDSVDPVLKRLAKGKSRRGKVRY